MCGVGVCDDGLSNFYDKLFSSLMYYSRSGMNLKTGGLIHSQASKAGLRGRGREAVCQMKQRHTDKYHKEQAQRLVISNVRHLELIQRAAHVDSVS